MMYLFVTLGAVLATAATIVVVYLTLHENARHRTSWRPRIRRRRPPAGPPAPTPGPAPRAAGPQVAPAAAPMSTFAERVRVIPVRAAHRADTPR